MALSLVLLVLCTSVAVSSVRGDVSCGPNERPKAGIDCKSDCCPGQSCPDPCASACTCSFQHHRVSNGTCIPSRECPPIPCPENEHFETCPVCNENCTNAVPSGKRCRYVGQILITVNCEPACRCDDYYWRDGDRGCVPYEDCPQYEDCE